MATPAVRIDCGSFKILVALQDLLILEESGLLVSCAEDKKIAIWDYRNQKVLKTIQKENYFKTLDYIASQKVLIAGNMDKKVYTFLISEFLDRGKFARVPAGEDVKEARAPAEETKKDHPEPEEEEKTYVLEEREQEVEEQVIQTLKEMNQLLND